MMSRKAGIRLGLLLFLVCFILSGCQPNELPPQQDVTPGAIPVREDVRLLFADHGWTVCQLIATLDVEIPSEFPGNMISTPSSVYWAMVNVYSEAIGFDMREYAGEKVQLEILNITENLQERLAGRYEFPSWFEESGRALAVRKDNQIIGAWLDQTGRYGYSLSGESIENITGLPMEDWLDELRSAGEGAAAKTVMPETVIQAYFSAYADNDYGLAFGELSSRFMLEHVFSNLDEHKLFNADFQLFPSGAKAEVISIVEQDYPESDLVAGNRRLFRVRFNLELPANVVSAYTEGVNERFFCMVRTLDKLGWKIDAIATGF